MDTIYECAAKFSILEDFEYRFVLSKKRKSFELHLNFLDSDFSHLAGFQYLSDINLPHNHKNTLKDIIETRKITDRLLEKSRFYNSKQFQKNVKSRIEELRFLEEYLDTNNFIRIFTTRDTPNIHSRIRAEYIIESRLEGGNESVYIFLAHRGENSKYLGVISFFKKGEISYGGEKLYWMLKEKYREVENVKLYQHPDYK